MPSSLPGLVAGILQSHRAWQVPSAAQRFEATPLVPAYQVEAALPVAARPAATAQAITELVQKLDRLKVAYPYWPAFDPSPYFDIYPAHGNSFLRAEETRQVLRLRFYADLLLPEFREAERYWVQSFLPAYHAGRNGSSLDAFRTHLVQEASPQLARLLDQAEEAIQKTLDVLSDRLEVLSCLGGLEERIQHRPPPGAGLAPGLSASLQRLPRQVPTLTLDVIYHRAEIAEAGQGFWRAHDPASTQSA